MSKAPSECRGDGQNASRLRHGKNGARLRHGQNGARLRHGPGVCEASSSECRDVKEVALNCDTGKMLLDCDTGKMLFVCDTGPVCLKPPQSVAM